MPRCKVAGTQYDSHLEAEVAKHAKDFTRIPSRQKPSCFDVVVHMGYNPDFSYKGKHHTVYIEAKGRLYDRNREVLQHLDVAERKNVKFILMNPFIKYKSKAKSTITQWLEKYGYEWVYVKDRELDKHIKRWMKEADTGIYE